MAALTLLGVLLASAVTGAGTLTGKMATYDALLGPRWTCTLGKTTYFAAYSIEPPNTLHGHLYSNDSSEDAYYGYDAQRKRYWTASADSTGSIESQTSVDGITFVGTLNEGGSVSKATNVLTIKDPRKWIMRARGSEAGQPYDVTATCVR